MGSEDADLDELGKIYMNNEKIVWDTNQKGAVGRMNTKGLEKIIRRIEGEVAVQPFGKELVTVFQETYTANYDVQTATFRLLNSLFAEYGLIVLIPDNARLKKAMVNVFKDDLFNQVPSSIVEKTTERLAKHYKVQANPREINLFYLKDNIRELIFFNGASFEVRNTELQFSPVEMKEELKSHPDRFSPNVILRGLFQETILPNIAFIGGGGETAYWLELKDLFKHYNTPFPVLVVRNSFLFIEKKWTQKINRLKLSIEEIFYSTDNIINKIVRSNTERQLSLATEISRLRAEYQRLKNISAAVDPTLAAHVESLETRSVKAVELLEKKLLRAEKRKFEDESRQVNSLKEALFPTNGLQERIDNFIPWYARFGKDFFDIIYQHSLTLEQEFVVISEKTASSR
jgi:bacillithiol biosynthesis cysteine-adding enzyme BshC